MSLPKFTATESLYRNNDWYPHQQSGELRADVVVPAIPACKNCDYILDRCAQNGGRPRAVCWACAIGHCYTEDPMPTDPWTM